jgi:hypothetical protein
MHSRLVVTQCVHRGLSPEHLILWFRQAVQARATLRLSLEDVPDVWLGRCRRGMATLRVPTGAAIYCA